MESVNITKYIKSIPGLAESILQGSKEIRDGKYYKLNSDSLENFIADIKSIDLGE